MTHTSLLWRWLDLENKWHIIKSLQHAVSSKKGTAILAKLTQYVQKQKHFWSIELFLCFPNNGQNYGIRYLWRIQKMRILSWSFVWCISQVNFISVTDLNHPRLYPTWDGFLSRVFCLFVNNNFSYLLCSHILKLELRYSLTIGEGKVCIRAKWPIRTVLKSSFCNMKRLGILLLPPGWDVSPSQGYPPALWSPVPIHTPGQRETTWSKISCLRKQHDGKG